VLATTRSTRQPADWIRLDRASPWVTDHPSPRRRAARPCLLSTVEPQTLVAAFDDPDHPWWMQAQILLLSDRSAAPPDLDHAAAFALCDDLWVKKGRDLLARGLTGLVRPGVDGDVAGLWIPDPAQRSAVLGALEARARGTGHPWRELDEPSFAEQLSGPARR